MMKVDREKRFEKTIKDYDAMIHQIARRYFLNGYELEDKIQELYTKIWLEIDKYDQKKAKMSTWLYHILDNHMQNLVKSHNKHINTIFNLDVNLHESDKDVEITFENLIAMLKVDESVKQLLRMRYLDELTLREIGAKLGITHTAVSNRLKKYENELKDLTIERKYDILK